MAQSTALRESESGVRSASTSTSMSASGTIAYAIEPRLRITPSRAALASLQELVYITDSIFPQQVDDDATPSLTAHAESPEEVEGSEYGQWHAQDRASDGTQYGGPYPGSGSDSDPDNEGGDWHCDCLSGCGVLDGDQCDCVSTFGNFYIDPGSGCSPEEGDDNATPGVLNLDALPENLPLVECGSACRCGGSCSNRVTQRGLRVSILVRPSTGGIGLGAYYDPPPSPSGSRPRSADRVLRRGTFICLYAGEVLSTQEASSRWSTQSQFQGQEQGEGQGNYILTLRLPGSRIHIDPRYKGNVGRFFNHSCDPTCLVQAVRWGGDNVWARAAIFAKRDILPGEELTYDYANASGSTEPTSRMRDVKSATKKSSAMNTSTRGLTKCLCGARSCRGWMPFDPDV